MFRARVANPRWIASMIRHGYKGAAELSATVDYLFGYDATAGVAEDWMYEQVAERYLLDPDVAEFMARSNPWAARAIAERLLEAADRGLWAEPEDGDAGGDPRPLPRARGRARGGRGVSARFPLSAIVGQDALIDALLSTPSRRTSAACSCAASAAPPSRPRSAALAPLLPPIDAAADAARSPSPPASAARTGVVPADAPTAPRAGARWSSCRWARRSTAWWARSTSGARWPASRPSRPACSPAPTAGSSTWTR